VFKLNSESTAGSSRRTKVDVYRSSTANKSRGRIYNTTLMVYKVSY